MQQSRLGWQAALAAHKPDPSSLLLTRTLSALRKLSPALGSQGLLRGVRLPSEELI